MMGVSIDRLPFILFLFYFILKNFSFWPKRQPKWFSKRNKTTEVDETNNSNNNNNNNNNNNSNLALPVFLKWPMFRSISAGAELWFHRRRFLIHFHWFLHRFSFAKRNSVSKKNRRKKKLGKIVKEIADLRWKMMSIFVFIKNRSPYWLISNCYLVGRRLDRWEGKRWKWISNFYLKTKSRKKTDFFLFLWETSNEMKEESDVSLFAVVLFVVAVVVVAVAVVAVVVPAPKKQTKVDNEKPCAADAFPTFDVGRRWIFFILFSFWLFLGLLGRCFLSFFAFFLFLFFLFGKRPQFQRQKSFQQQKLWWSIRIDGIF